MLGQLLEFSIGARPVADSLAGYEALGLPSVPVGDIVAGAYAVVSDDRLALGLYDDEFEGPVPTFVRPRLEAHVRALRRAGIEFASLELADDKFHRAEFLDPGGHAVRLVEARTFSPPPARQATVSACGEFREVSFLSPELDESSAFWQRLGFETIEKRESPRPFVRLRGFGLTLGLYEANRPAAALTFAAAQLDARRAYLEAKGFTVRRGSPLKDHGSFALRLPGGIDAYLLEAE
jgi:hypothetical protein